MTGTVLAPGTPTPPDTLVFVPLDGRHAPLPPARLIAPVAYAWHSGSGLRRAGWILVPCLTGLRSEFNALAPGRDKASDGSIGDTSHAASSSDHNPDESGATPYEDSDSIDEVHAIDVDKDLRKSGWTMGRAVNIIRLRHQRGQDDRLQYIIWDGQIASRSWGWTWRAYTGANPHDKHAHFSARYTTAQESDTKPWGLLAADAPAPKPPAVPEEDDVNDADIAKIAAAVEAKVFAHPIQDRADQNTPQRKLPFGKWMEYTDTRHDQVMNSTAKLQSSLTALSAAVGAIAKNVAADDEDLPQILAAIEQARAEIPESVLDALAGEGRTVEDVAGALRVALGDRAQAVGALLAGE